MFPKHNPTRATPWQPIFSQVAEAIDGSLLPHLFLIRDHDSRISARFRQILPDASVTTP